MWGGLAHVNGVVDAGPLSGRSGGGRLECEESGGLTVPPAPQFAPATYQKPASSPSQKAKQTGVFGKGPLLTHMWGQIGATYRSCSLKACAPGFIVRHPCSTPRRQICSASLFSLRKATEMLATVEPPLSAKPMPRPRVTLQDVSLIGEQTTHVMDQMKSMAYMPNNGKAAPSYNATQLAKLCGVSGSAMLRALERAEDEQMPPGVVVDGGKRVFPVADARAWVRKLSKSFVRRTTGAQAATIAIANFKGGVGKTTITVNLAQGLSLKGYRVLVIDLDPQGSATSMLGHTPLAIEVEQTFLPLAADERETIRESVIQTYWDGVDLVAGNTGLHSAEFYLPARVIEAQRNGGVFNFEEVLNKGLDSVRDEYDFILIDNPPQLGYSTINALWAADAVLMPVVPEGLSVMSSSQFWTMFDELAAGVVSLGGREKDWAWVGVLPSMMQNKTQFQVMMQYIRSAYGNTVMRSEVPSTAVIEVGGTRLKTVYDFAKYVGDDKTYVRARDAFDELAYEVEQLTRETVWGLEPIVDERSAV